MKTGNWMEKTSRKLGVFGQVCKKNAPAVMVVSGVVGVVVSTVLACKATKKTEEVNEELRQELANIDAIMEQNEVAGIAVEEKEVRKTVAKAYGKAACKYAKLYAPSVVLGGLSIASILTSHKMMHGRNVALAAAYAATAKDFKDYRDRLVDKFGEDFDRELKYNLVNKEVEEVVVKEDGTEETVKKVAEVVDLDPSNIPNSSKFFDASCRGWVKNAEANMIFLKQTQRYCTDKLRTRGYLYLNEVYEALGIDTTKDGQVLGWIYDESEDSTSDNYVDFGIYNVTRPANRAFVNGYEPVILLNFNHDGYIADKFHLFDKRRTKTTA